MIANVISSSPFASSLDPLTGYKTDFYSINDFVQSCIDVTNFKVKSESYICSEYTDYDCEGCYAFPLANPEKLTDIQGYRIEGNAKKYDKHQIPHALTDTQVVAFSIGKGQISANTNKAYISHVLGTDNVDLFLQLARAGEAIVFHKDIDQAYQIINAGMPETIFRAITGFNEPKLNQDLFIGLDKHFSAILPGQIRNFYLEKINYLKQAIDSDTFLQETINEWGDLLPLSQKGSIVNTPYPINALPSLAREAVIAISEHVQAPIAMSAQCVIGAMSHISQARVNAPHPSNPKGEPCSLYLLTEGQSGSRKSTTRNLADKAILQHEYKQYELYRHELERWKNEQAGLNKKDRESYCSENSVPQDPSSIYSDITLESIASMYVEGVINNASIASDEAGQFFGGYNMKMDTRTHAISAYVKLFDDGFVERTRSKSNINGSGRAYDVRLTFNLQGQHEILADALQDPILRGQGFLPRFILTVPENIAGTRLQDAAYRTKNADTDPRLVAYWARCKYLLDEYPRPLTDQPQFNGRHVMHMNVEAIDVDIYFYNLFESLQAAGKRYQYLQAFASRASQLARRLATVFAYFEGSQIINGQLLRGAYEIINHSLNEWLKYADVEANVENEAERLIKWMLDKCKKYNEKCLQYSYIQTSCPRPMQKNSKLLSMIMQQLEDSNYLKIEMLNKKRIVILNPKLLQK